MFLKQLRIESEDGLIRDLNFHQGLNLIVDETPDSNTETGNNVGKTTVLRLIDICLGKEYGFYINTGYDYTNPYFYVSDVFVIDIEYATPMCSTGDPTGTEGILRIGPRVNQSFSPLLAFVLLSEPIIHFPFT